MNPADFKPTASGTLIQAAKGAATYWAFRPHPLPPQVAYTNELLLKLSEADRRVGELSGLSRNLPSLEVLTRPFLTQEAVLSSRIEGTRTDFEGMLDFEVSTSRSESTDAADRRAADAQEVYNHFKALNHGLASITDDTVLFRLVRELHRMQMQGVRGQHATPGEFRRSQNWIGTAGSDLARAIYVPPPADEIPELIHKLEEFVTLNRDIPPLIRLAMIHYQFEAIHPFLDGNGRIGRLLIVLLAVHWGLLPGPLLPLSRFFERRRPEYYRHLTSVSREGAWAEWLSFFLTGVAEESQHACACARSLLDLQDEWRKRVLAENGKQPMLDTVTLAIERPVLTAPIVQERLGVTNRWALMCLRRLVAMGILREKMIGKRLNVFVADEVIRLFDREEPIDPTEVRWTTE